MTDDLKAAAKRMRRRKLSYARIGAELGRSAQTVRRWLTRKAKARQRAAYARYSQTERGLAARKRAEANRAARRRQAEQSHRLSLKTMFD